MLIVEVGRFCCQYWSVATSQGGVAIRSFHFYEFVGILIPGFLLLVGLGLLFPNAPLVESFALPDNLGGAAVQIILAYAVGHLVQAGGNLFEYVYWWLRRGMPINWPFSRKLKTGRCRADLAHVVERASGIAPITTVDEWDSAVAKIRTRATADGLTSRMEIFNGNYGMFRGIVVSGLVLLLASFFSRAVSAGLMACVLAAIVALATYRMDRFAKHYASEFFNCARIIADTEGE